MSNDQISKLLGKNRLFGGHFVFQDGRRCINKNVGHFLNQIFMSCNVNINLFVCIHLKKNILTPMSGLNTNDLPQLLFSLEDRVPTHHQQWNNCLFTTWFCKNNYTITTIAFKSKYGTIPAIGPNNCIFTQWKQWKSLQVYLLQGVSEKSCLGKRPLSEHQWSHFISVFRFL